VVTVINLPSSPTSLADLSLSTMPLETMVRNTAFVVDQLWREWDGGFAFSVT